VPPGLAPGETYRVVFVTADTTDIYSQDISDYNSFVTAEANEVASLAALDTTWTVIGSTEAVSALTNVDLSAPGAIYNLAGLEVAADTYALFDVVSTPLLNPVDYDQFGDLLASENVWTGTCDTGGSPPFGSICEGIGFGDDEASVGLNTAVSSAWLVDGTFEDADAQEPLYAISSTLTVPEPVPEPATVSLSFLGLMALAATRISKARSR
jgi:hypothetical protein